MNILDFFEKYILETIKNTYLSLDNILNYIYYYNMITLFST